MYLQKKGLLPRTRRDYRTDAGDGLRRCYKIVAEMYPGQAAHDVMNLHQRAADQIRATAMKHTLTLLILIAFAAVVNPDAVYAQHWLHYEPETVELDGKLVIQSKFGPPNYGEDPKTDEKVRVPVLMLPYQVSMFPTADGDNTNPVYSIRQIQLAFVDKTMNYKNLIGKNVVVTGTLFKAQTGHHYTEVVLTVGSIKPRPAVQQLFDVCWLITAYSNPRINTSNSMLTQFRAVVGEEPTQKTFKYRDTGLVINMAVKYDGPDSEKPPTRIRLALVISNKEEEDVFEFTDRAEAGTIWRGGWGQLFVEKRVRVGDTEHIFSFSCRSPK